MAYIFPESFTKIANQAWKRNKKVLPLGRNIPTLPSAKDLTYLLSVCFFASLKREELRSTRFKIALVSRQAIHKEVEDDLLIRNLLVFETPKPFVPQTLRKLSPTLNPNRSLFLTSIAEDKNSSRFAIWGMYHHGSMSERAEKGEHQLVTTLPFSCPVISVTGSGTIELSRGSVPIARMSEGGAGEAKVFPLYSLWFARKFSQATKVVSRATSEIQKEAPEVFGKGPQGLSLTPGLQVLHTLIQLVNAVSKIGHGGTIVFIKRQDYHKAVRSRSLRASIEFDQSAAKRLLLNTSGVELVYDYANWMASRGRGQYPSSPQAVAKGISRVYQDYVKAKDSFRDSIEFIAQLSAIDGAVFLDDSLNVLGAGVMIDTRLGEPKTAYHATDDDGGDVARLVPVRMDDFGARHRSAMKAVFGLRNTTAFVVSQDGGARLIAKRNRRVVIWSDPLSLPYET